MGELSGTGVGYASSAISSVLSTLGIGSGEAFGRDDGKIETFVKAVCDGPFQTDSAVLAMLLGIAMGKSEVLKVESSERRNSHVKLVLEPTRWGREMAMRENVILFLALWILVSAILSPSTGIFLTIALIGMLIALEVGEFYLLKDVKDSLKFSAYLLLLAFAFIVARKVYEVIK